MPLLSRYNPYQQNPYGMPTQRINPQTGMPWSGPVQQPQPGQAPDSDMPWGSNGQAFDDMYAPMKPQAPTGPAKPRSPFGQPMQMPGQDMGPMPSFQMGQFDPSSLAYPPGTMDPVAQQQQPRQGGGLMNFGKALQQQGGFDPSQAAYQPGAQQEPFNFMGMGGSDMVQLGLSILGASQNGGDWGKVADAYGGIQQNIMAREDRAREIKRQEKADAREQKKFDVWDLEQQDAASKRARWEAARQAADPETQTLLDQLGPEGYGQFLLENKRQESAAKLAALEAAQREKLTKLEIAARASEGDKDRANAIKAAQVRLQGDLDATIANATALSGINQLSAAQQPLEVANSTVGDLDRMNTLVGELQNLGGMNNIFDMPLRKMFEYAKGKGGEAVKAKLEEFEKLQSDLVTQKAQLMKPVSNADFEYFKRILANPNMTVQGALNIINGMKEQVSWDIGTNAFNTDWNKKYKGIAGTVNEKGQTAIQARGQRPAFDPGKYLPESSGTAAPGGGEIPNNAVVILKQDPSPQARREFDAIFGAGAADRILGTAQPGNYRGR